ncbi:4-(cytidine 5'-diphospho)-2-C-methyl-D-erythritol kinase [Halanaerobaculum tunisiense]
MDFKAYAKVNLTLDVLGQRADGYHEVEMIMQTINLFDQLSFTQIEQGIQIKADHPQLPTGESNLVYQAAELLFTEFDLAGGLEVIIDKEIPIAAGLAGGSTNAAATLVAINRLWDLGLSQSELATRGAKLGADVPFCISGGSQLATGVGTELEQLPCELELYLVVVNPPLEVSTPRVYDQLDVDKITSQPQTTKVRKALAKQNFQGVISNLGNVLEQATFKLYPQVATLKERLEELTAKALMSGSGPTIFGVVTSKQQADQIQTRLAAELASDYRVLVTKTINHGLEEI